MINDPKPSSDDCLYPQVIHSHLLLYTCTCNIRNCVCVPVVNWLCLLFCLNTFCGSTGKTSNTPTIHIHVHTP